VPRVIVTDKLASYQVAGRELVPSVTHRRSQYLNIHTEFAGARPSPR
jgi:putative transposase